MTDLSNQGRNRRQPLMLAGQLVAIAGGIALVIVAITTFLSFLSDECQRGAPFLPQVFVCFPAG
jgi:hypothetical protein